MGILENLGLIVVSSLEESIGDNRRDWSPQKEILKALCEHVRLRMDEQSTLRSRRTDASKRSPNKKNTASGTASTSFGLERTSLPTSFRTNGDLKRSVRNIAIAGSMAQAVRMIPSHVVSMSPRSVAPVKSVERLPSFVGLFHTDNRNSSDSVNKRNGMLKSLRRVP